MTIQHASAVKARSTTRNLTFTATAVREVERFVSLILGPIVGLGVPNTNRTDQLP
jgi:hypothetical protein